VDETAFTAATASSPTEFVTGIVDLTRRPGGVARLLDVVEGRSAGALGCWISQREPDWRAAVAAASLDRYRGYASALRTGLPEAVRVLDAFHVTRLGFAAVDDVRRRIQQELTGHRGRRHDPLYRIRRVLRRGYDHHTDRSWARLVAGLDAGDTTDEQLAKTWIAAQELRLLYHCQSGPEPSSISTPGWCTAPMPASPNWSGWPAPSTPGGTSCWPTSTPTASPTDPPKRSTC
jgi:transposase